MKKRIRRDLSLLMTVLLIFGSIPVYAADDAGSPEAQAGEAEAPSEDAAVPEEDAAAASADAAVNWPVPGADWYEAYDYTLKEEDGVIELNNYKSGNTAEYVVVPATATIAGKNYSVVLNTINPDNSTVSLWGSYNQTIKGIKILEGVKAKKCSHLFYSLPELTDLDLSGLDTSGVTDMTNFLCYSRKLTNLTLGDLDTSAVTSMEGMFEGIAVSSLDLKGFDTTHVTSMSQMFYQCTELVDLDLSSFATPALTEMSWMFYECEKLENLRWGDGLDTSKVQTMYDMFCRCEKLKDAGLSRFNTSNVTSMSSMFCGCEAMTEIDLRNFDFSKVESMSYMFYNCDSIRTVYFPEEMSTPALKDMNAMFSSCKKLVKVDLSRFDTGNVTDMSDMFDYDEQLREVLFSDRFITSKVTDMRGMFRQCFRLQVLDVSSFDTSNVTSMDSMFESCDALRTIDVSGFDTSKVTDMGDMFYNCESVLSLDVSRFDTSNVTDLYHMFRGCSRLRSLDLSSFNTEKVENFYQLFFECRDLTVADLRSFDFSNGTPIETSGSGDLHSFIGDSGIRHLYLPVKAMSGFDFTRDLSISGEAGYALTDIFYAGTQEEWTALGNTVPANVTMHYEYTDPSTPIVPDRTPVSSISPETHELSLKAGSYKYVPITVSPENATDRGTVSISSDPTVAYSDNYATIWALKPGSCTITVYALDGSGVTGSIAVTVTEGNGDEPGPGPDPDPDPGPDPADPIPGGGGATDPQPLITNEANQSLTLVKGQKFVMADKGWKSSAKKTLAVSKKNVTAKKAGEADLTFGAHTIHVTVLAPILSGDEKKLKKEAGDEFQLSLAGVKASGGKILLAGAPEALDILFVSSAPDVATVDEDGNVRTVAKGSSTITAYVNGVAFKYTLKVAESSPAAERTLHLNKGKSKTIKLKGQKSPWTISGNNIVSVSKRNKITAKETGETTLVYEGYTIHVYVEDPSIEDTGKFKKTYTMSVGQSMPIPLKSLYRTPFFKSNKSYIAYADEDGMIYARSKGTAKITGKINGRTVTITVKVQ
ncbi:MAG: BspA family leucine-rich repeat surface protein [Lachnospiraceae bacterium]|nr:BspA family leucine-rich repeat surface protein [Lachnospiraceae bacterium]